MKFTEAKLEAAIIQLLGEQGYAHGGLRSTFEPR
jgi:hypothetical protein